MSNMHFSTVFFSCGHILHPSDSSYDGQSAQWYNRLGSALFLLIIGGLTCGVAPIYYGFMALKKVRLLNAASDARARNVQGVGDNVLKPRIFGPSTQGARGDSRNIAGALIFGENMWKEITEESGQIERCVPMAESALSELLAKEPELLAMWGNANGVNKAIVTEHIKAFYFHGHPAVLGKRSSNNSIFQQHFQFLIFKIHQEQNPEKQKIMLKELGYMLKDCAALTITRVMNKVEQLRNKCNHLKAQFFYFIAAEKNKAFIEAMHKVCPFLQYELTSDTPANRQEIHLKSAFLKKFGRQYGLNTLAACTDHHATYQINSQEEQEFTKQFEKILAENLIKNLVKEINTEIKSQKNKCISNKEFSTYFSQQIPRLLGEIQWDEDQTYPDYLLIREDPGYIDNEIPAFITENFARTALEHFGFLKPQPLIEVENGSMTAPEIRK